MELIVRDGNAAILNPAISAQIAEFERAVKEIKEREEELKARILAEMERNNIIKLDTPEVSISYVAEFDRETLDTKSLRKEHPDLYDSYVRISTVKPSIRIKIK